MAIGVNTRSTIAFFKHEVTAGTAVTPDDAADGYFALSEGFSSTFEKDLIESDLVTGSIGQRKGQTGLLDTGGSFENEFKGSGVEGQKPEYAELVETLMGQEDLQAEFDTIAGSTTTDINVDAGEGASFKVGQSVLVKHAGFPHEIKPIKSIAGDVLTIDNGTLDNAPAITTDLGQAIMYSPTDKDHPSGTFGLYWGNEIFESIPGCLVESLAIDIPVGQMIKAAWELTGLNNTRADGAAGFSPTFDASEGLVALDVLAFIDGVCFDFNSASINITNDIKELTSAKPVTGKVSNRAGERTVETNLVVFADDTTVDNQDKFNNLTDFAFFLVAGKKDSGGNYIPGQAFTIYMPRCYFTAAPFGSEDDILTEELAFRAHIGTGLDEVFINFL